MVGTRRQSLWFAQAALFWLLASAIFLPSVRAHLCGPAELHLAVGDACPWRITADHVETTTTYTQFVNGPKGVINLTPATPFQAHHGDFVIRGLAPGTNDVFVNWVYPGTGAAGICKVTVVVTAPAQGQSSFQTSQGHGQLCTYELGKYIEARTLRSMLDFYVPAATPKLIVLTECFGGNVAQSPFFVNLTNTAIASGTSPNQEGRTGGYPDDAMRALKPEAGRTAADVHQAGTVGRQTVEQVDNPQNDKQTAFILSEWPTVAGGLSLSAFSLAPVSTNGPIESRHIVMYSGKPISKQIKAETHGGATIPSIDGEKMLFGDPTDRDTLKQNFANEPNTTITTAGGEPQEGNPQLGQNGWDYSGTFDGLEAAIKKAGDAIRNSPHPALEQFILFVGDHGMMGNLGNAPPPERPVTPNSRSELAPAFQSFRSDSAAAFYMEQDPENVPGFLLSLEFGQSPVPVPAFKPGDLALEFDAPNQEPLLLRDFLASSVDIDGDGMLGTVDGEGISLFFPVNEQLFLQQFTDRQLDIFFVNHSSQAMIVSKLEQVTGSIEPGWTPSPRPKIFGPVFRGTSMEFMLQGSLNRSYLIESSSDLRTWRQVTTLLMDNTLKSFRDQNSSAPIFYRAHLVE